MRVTGDLGFSSLVLVLVWLVVPVIGFVIRRKWQLAAARREEIKRLLILAAEETARAESEESYVYGAVSVASNNQCAVCYSPTPTRCARCKVVRYCSAKCQIIHWRQGHKEECRPPGTVVQSNDVVSDLGQKEAEQDHHDNHWEKCEIEDKQCKRSSKKPPLCVTSSSPEVSCGKDDDIRAEPLADGNITDSNSELSSNSFSGFSASTSSSESSDDASVCDSIISNEHEGSEGHIFIDNNLDMLDTISNDISMGTTISPSPKFASLVDSVDGFSVQKVNQLMPGFSKQECHIESNGTSGLNMCNGVTVEPCRVPSGLHDKTHDSRKIEDGANDDPIPSRSNESTGNKESESGSSFRFSYGTLPLSHAQGPEARSSVSDDAFPNFVQNNKPSTGSASSENDSMDSLEPRNSSSIDNKRSNVINYVTDQSEPRGDNFGPPLSSTVHGSSCVGKVSGCTDISSICNLKSVGTKVSNLVENPDSNSHQLKSAEVRTLPCNVADAPLASNTGGSSYLSTECGNNSVHSGISSSSQLASCPPNSKNGLKSSVLKVVDQFKGSNLSKSFPLAVGSDGAGRYSDKLLQGLFPYDLFVKLYNWNKVELRAFGLINCGNSCYANAVLQCLAFTPPLTAYLLQGLHSKICATEKWCFTCEFESLILKSKGTKSPLSPVNILSQLQNIGSQLGNGREEDAHEFLRYAIDTMQSVCLRKSGINASGSLEEETTLMGLTFGGYLRSKIKCMKCGGKSERQERMMDLTVEIEGEIATLEEALRRFTSTENLDGENKYQCVRCKSYEKAKKKLTISEAPNVLTIALKRFQSGKFGKLNKPIRYPEILDLAPFMSGTSDKSPIYRLYGVVVHLDVMNAAFSGHYVCYVKNIQNKWFKVDDSVVTAVELDRVLTKGAYMLLYARCSPRAPRLIRNMITSPDSKSRVNGKTTTMKSTCVSANSGAAEYSTNSISPNGSSTLDSFYSKFHRLKRILEEDSSSDNSSLISSNSDEGSCSTDSTHDSTSTDDFSDYIFGDSGRGWNSMWRCSDSDTSSSSSSSPLYSRHSPLADMDRYDSGSPEATELRTHTGSSGKIDGPLYRLSYGVRRPTDTERVGSDSLLHSDKTIQNRKLDSSISSRSSSSRETDSFQRLVSNHLKEIDSGVSCRTSRERTE